MQRWRTVTSAVLLCLGSVMAGSVPASAAAMTSDRPIRLPADKGLTVASTFTYTVDPAATVVHVTAEMSFTNIVPNKVEGNYIDKAYFTAFTVPLPAEATNVVALQDGSPIAATPDYVDGETTFFVDKLDFTANLFYQQTANVVLTYDILGHPPRDEGVTRVNAAYAAFPAYGIADAGKLTVRVVVPDGYVIDTFGDDATMTEEDGNVVYTATDIAQPDQFTIFVSARADGSLATADRTVGDASFVVRSWPDDADWAGFIDSHLDSAIPELEQLIGEPWPVSTKIQITEAITPYLYGYAGWYNSVDRKLELGEDLDPQVLVHELSHAYFNDSWFGSRWIDEGLAQTYSDLANQAAGEAAVTPDAVDLAGPGAQPLNSWADSENAGDQEDYGYNASWFVIDGLVDEIGVEKMRAVFNALGYGYVSYPGDDAQSYPVPGDWRRLLDLAENYGGSTTAEDLFSKYVVTPAEAAKLADRLTARTQYQQLQDKGGEWAPPFYIRAEMSDWLFDKVGPAITEASAVLDQRDALLTSLDDLGVAIEPRIETSYELAQTDLALAKDHIATQQAAADHAMADRASTLAAVTALGVKPTPAFTVAYRPAGATIDQIETNLATIDDATTAVESAIERDGRHRAFPALSVGGDAAADTSLEQAKAALADGDAALATTKASAAISADDASDAVVVTGTVKTSIALGLVILVIAAALVLVLLVLAAVVVAVRRRRRRRPVADEPTEQSQEATTPEDAV